MHQAFPGGVLGGLFFFFKEQGDAEIQGLCSLGVLLLLGLIQHQLSRMEEFILPGKMATALTQGSGSKFSGE